MIKKLILAAVATAFVAATAIPIQVAPAAAEAMTCKKAAKAKFAKDRKARRAYRKECKAESKA
jgi:Ni/Co efflux regulator RcnB